MSTPVPEMLNVYGFSSESLLAMLIVAVRTPVAVGSKRIVKVVVPLALIGLVGCVIMEKSAAFAPLMLTMGDPFKVRLAVPVFSMVKMRSTVPLAMFTSPKSV